MLKKWGEKKGKHAYLYFSKFIISTTIKYIPQITPSLAGL